MRYFLCGLIAFLMAPGSGWAQANADLAWMSSMVADPSPRGVVLNTGGNRLVDDLSWMARLTGQPAVAPAAVARPTAPAAASTSVSVVAAVAPTVVTPPAAAPESPQPVVDAPVIPEPKLPEARKPAASPPPSLSEVKASPAKPVQIATPAVPKPAATPVAAPEVKMAPVVTTATPAEKPAPTATAVPVAAPPAETKAAAPAQAAPARPQPPVNVAAVAPSPRPAALVEAPAAAQSTPSAVKPATESALAERVVAPPPAEPSRPVIVAAAEPRAASAAPKPESGTADARASRGETSAAKADDASARVAAATPRENLNDPVRKAYETRSEYRIGPQDLLEIEVFNVNDLKRTVRVNSNGLVTLPLIGNVNVGSLTAQEAEALIASQLAEKYLQNPQVSVFIREFTSQRFTVEGAVNKPGIYPMTGRITLLRALALAGGGATMADMSEIKMFRFNERGDRETFSYNADDIRNGTKEDPVLRNDDVVVVQRDRTRALLRDSVLRDVIDSINPFSVLGR